MGATASGSSPCCRAHLCGPTGSCLLLRVLLKPPLLACSQGRVLGGGMVFSSWLLCLLSCAAFVRSCRGALFINLLFLAKLPALWGSRANLPACAVLRARCLGASPRAAAGWGLPGRCPNPSRECSWPCPEGVCRWRWGCYGQKGSFWEHLAASKEDARFWNKIIPWNPTQHPEQCSERRGCVLSSVFPFVRGRQSALG